ncbi:hypothetical protein GcM1_248066b [Golovinomyces cichoracearum]|uniref:Uncharacterized protein n=1 Tax=Golovinomyces cichoracearum TaxID=62708 RepID=A0A420ICQ3_9PEZI|nr:hypothetical protein GcM1_248066b [Golovinomyces cichoracearum]
MKHMPIRSQILESEHIDGTIKLHSQGENEKNGTQRYKNRPAANKSQEMSTNNDKLNILEILNNIQIQLSEQKNENCEIRTQLKQLQENNSPPLLSPWKKSQYTSLRSAIQAD